MQKIYLDGYNQNGYFNYRVPSIICTKRGTVLVCVEARHGGDWGATDLMLYRSADYGKTWDPRRVLIPGKGISVIHNIVLFDDDDRIHLLWHKNYREGFVMHSFDDGITWTQPQSITYAYEEFRKNVNWTVIAAGPGHGLVTKSGRLIVPAWIAYNQGNITEHRPSVVTTLYSDDRGETWQCGEMIPNTEDFVNPNESILAELSDGSFLINCRHETGTDCRKIGFSPDGVHGWHDFTFYTQLLDPICCAGMTQSDDRLYFMNCASKQSEGRINLSLRESRDDGKTWSEPYLIEKTGGYSDLYFEKESQKLFAVMECGRADDNNRMTFNISVAVFDACDLTEMFGRDCK